MKLVTEFSGRDKCPLCEKAGTEMYFGVLVCNAHWEELTGLKLNGPYSDWEPHKLRK